jgi:hypothetical protein
MKAKANRPVKGKASVSGAGVSAAVPARGHLHLGDLLVRDGVLTIEQRDRALHAQRARGGPFGVIVEEMFGVSPCAVEKAWSEQYASLARVVDPRRVAIDPQVLSLVDRRQAWQFRILPLALRGDGLLACTTQSSLVRALRFAGWRLGHSCQVVLAEPTHLGEALAEHYPLAGMSPESILEELPSLAR